MVGLNELKDLPGASARCVGIVRQKLICPSSVGGGLRQMEWTNTENIVFHFGLWGPEWVNRYRTPGGRAGPQVRFGSKTDLIPMPNPVVHASRLCNRAEEYGHAGSSECDPRAQASAVWNKGKQQSRRCDPNMSGRSGRNSRSKAALATWPCSIWQSTASFAAVMLSPFGSRMSPQAVTRPIAQRFDKRKLGDPSDLN